MLAPGFLTLILGDAASTHFLGVENRQAFPSPPTLTRAQGFSEWVVEVASTGKGTGNTMHSRATWAAGISILLLCMLALAGTGWTSPRSTLEEVVDVLPQGTTRQEMNQASMQLAGTIVTVPVCTMGSCRQYDACMDRCVCLFHQRHHS